jgi:hypothetical protein
LDVELDACRPTKIVARSTALRRRNVSLRRRFWIGVHRHWLEDSTVLGFEEERFREERFRVIRR